MAGRSIKDHYLVKKTSQEAGPSKASGAKFDDPGSSQCVPKTDIEILKQFDLQWEYGPCTGITRLERWERAETHGLKPPAAVKDLLQKYKDDERYTKNLWKDYEI